MNINIEDIEVINNFKREINARDLTEIRWFKDGIEVAIPKEDITEWKFIGLDNFSFGLDRFIKDVNKT